MKRESQMNLIRYREGNKINTNLGAKNFPCCITCLGDAIHSLHEHTKSKAYSIQILKAKDKSIGAKIKDKANCSGFCGNCNSQSGCECGNFGICG